VAVSELLRHLRDGLPDGLLPPFFYLASCHGNDPGEAGLGSQPPEAAARRCTGRA